MLSRLLVTTPPSQLPVAPDLARRHLRSVQNSDDDILQLYIQTATEQAEAYLNRTLLQTSYQWVMSDTYPPFIDTLMATPLVIVPIAIAFNGIGTWHRLLEIPRAPVTAVASVVMGSWGAADTTLVLGTDYDLDLQNDPPRIRLDDAISFATYDHMAITYTAGYGTDPSAIPASIKHAILLLTASLYERRGDEEMFIPTAFYRLLDQHRLKAFPPA
jgi:hypothetical protein